VQVTWKIKGRAILAVAKLMFRIGWMTLALKFFLVENVESGEEARLLIFLAFLLLSSTHHVKEK
jgi:hypothetical protein